MSQEKVDRYKQEKANRKKTMAKEKLKKKLYIVAGVVVTIAFAVWIVWSVQAERKAKREQEEMLAAIQSQIVAIQSAAQTANKTTGATDNKTTADEKTTAADDKTTSADEKASEEETTKAADDSKKE